jgi:hypothetical protein
MNAARADLDRYAKLIQGALAAAPPAFTPRVEKQDAIQVERGVLFPAGLMGVPLSTVEPWIDRLLSISGRDLASCAIVDQRGHRRPAYRALLVYAALNGMILIPDAPALWKAGLLQWVEAGAKDLEQFDWPADPDAPLPSASGATATAAAWSALALHAAEAIDHNDAWRRLAASTFGQFARRQLPTGQFLAAGRSDNPETHWYHELVILHALVSFAIQTGDANLIAAAARNTAFHQAETQPDHATHQPWGLPAFILDRATHPLADQLLHSATTLTGAGGPAVSGITSILLADALYCLRLLLK